MGLDMYLTKRIYIGANYEHRKISGTIELKRSGEPIKIDASKINTIEETTAYWRKANQIHKWFVDNVQGGVDDCRDAYVSKDQLKTLYNLCKQVLDNKELAPQLLPSQEGFFFGSTDYNEYYFQDLENTIEMLQPIIDSPEDNSYEIDYKYSSSW